MSRFSRSWALCAALLWSCLVAFSCHPQPTESAPAPRPKADLRLLVLTDPRGYLEPCGCQARMLGGVDKLATTVAAQRKAGMPSLLLAAGDLAFGTELNPKDLGAAQAQEQWRAETLIDVWKSLGMAAVAPGTLDLASPALQQALATRGGFPWLSENLSDSEGNPWRGYTRAQIVNAGPLKVGVFGLVAPSPAVRVPEGAKLDEDLASITKTTVDALRTQGAQIVVLLLSGDRRVAKQLAGRGPDVIVLGGADSEEAIAPSTSGGAVVVNAGRQGQRLLTLDLTLRAGEWHDASSWTAEARKKALQTERDDLATKIATWEKDPKVAARDLEAMRQKLAGLDRDLAAQSAPRYDGRWFAAEITDLSPEVPEDARVKAILEAHDLRVNQANAKMVVPPVPVEEGKASYVGSETCRACHTAAYEWWRGTKHGRAYDTLVKVNKQFNLSCVGCHVVGYQKPGGSTVTHLGDSGVLKDVGCESCHGPGSLHVQSSGETQFVTKDPPEGTCVTCHNHEHSARFQYQAFRSLLIVPGHGKPLAGASVKGAP